MSTATPPSPSPVLPTDIDFSPGRKAIMQQHVALRLDGVLADRYSLVVLPPASSLNTASWSYHKGSDGSEGRHIITFGPKLAENQKSGSLGDYATAYHRHEVAHSLWTERNLVKLSKECDKIGVPFAALNIFEDARIEHLWREKFEEPFGWETYEGVRDDPKAGDPLEKRTLDGLMALIHNEDQSGILEGRLADLPEKEDVKAFYDRIIGAEKTSDLFPLLTEWKDRYGLPPAIDNGSSKIGGGDLSAGVKALSDKRAKAELKTAEEAGDGSGELQSVVPTGQKAGYILSGTPDVINTAHVEKLADILRLAYKGGTRKVVKATPSKRISMRHFVLEREKIFRAVEHHHPGAVKMSIIFDCSGSMNGPPNVAGRHLVAALGQLAREGKVKGDLILTIGLAEARNQVIPLAKVDPIIAGQIPANGSFEGFKSAMTANLSRLKGQSIVLGYTDGNITDSPIDRKMWHAMGLYSIGCYVGPSACSMHLGRWFDRPLCRSTDLGLALALRDLLAIYSKQGTSEKPIEPLMTVLKQRASPIRPRL